MLAFPLISMAGA